MKKMLLLILLIPFISQAQVPVEKYMPHAFYQTVSYPNLSASLPLKLNASKQVVAAKILIGECDTTLSVNGIIGYPRFWKMRDSLLGIIAGMGGGGGSPGGVSGNVQWNNAGAFAGFGATNGTYLNIAGGVATSGTRNYPAGVSMGISVAGSEGELDAYNGPSTGYVTLNVRGNPVKFFNSLSEVARINANGLGIGLASASPWLHIAAGEAARAPIKLTTGTPLTTPEDGAIEYHSSHLYFTIGSTRYQLDQQGGFSNPLTTTGDIIYSSSGTTAARLGVGATNQVLQVVSGVPAWGVIVDKGTATPTATGLSNVAATNNPIVKYTRSGDQVNIVGYILVTPSAGSVPTNLKITIPVASDFTTSTDCIGSGSGSENVTYIPVKVNATSDDQIQLQFTSINTSPHIIQFNAIYTIL